MDIEFDPAKDASNIARHGISLAEARNIEIYEILADDRRDYGEMRFNAYGEIEGRYFAMAFTMRGAVVRVISLRRAHAKEVRRHVRSE